MSKWTGYVGPEVHRGSSRPLTPGLWRVMCNCRGMTVADGKAGTVAQAWREHVAEVARARGVEPSFARGWPHEQKEPAPSLADVPVVVDEAMPPNVVAVRGETTAYVNLPPRRPPVELLTEGWDGLTELLDPVLAQLPPEQVTPIMARLMVIGMAVEELRP